MDALITTILAGVVVAAIGALAAYYFGGLRERQTQTYEEHRDEQKRQEARQDELNKERAKALDEMRTQCRLVIEAYEQWTARAANLEHISSPKIPIFSTWELPREVQESVGQGDAVLQEMKVQDGLYQAHKPRLETRTRGVFESFHKEFNERHTLLQSRLRNLRTKMSISSEEGASAVGLSSLPLVNAIPSNLTQPRILAHLLQDDLREVSEAARFARGWDYAAHLRAFEMEAERVAGTHS